MNDPYQTNNLNQLFQPNFQELAFSRSMSFCSFFGGEQKNNFCEDLDLEIQDVVEFDDVELQNYQLPEFMEEMEGDELWIGEEEKEQMVAVSVEGQREREKLIVNEGGVSVEVSEKAEEVQVKKGKASKTAKIPKVQKISKNDKAEKIPKTFYEKNICRNIIRKLIRKIEQGSYKEQLLFFCKSNQEFYQELRSIMVSNLELITGPAALKEFLLVEDDISKVMKKYTRWYLKERYLRDALDGGQMNNLEKYMEYKNKVLLPIVEKL